MLITACQLQTTVICQSRALAIKRDMFWGVD